MPQNQARVVWTGSLEKGDGRVEGGAGALRGKVSLQSRVHGAVSGETSPEELLASAHGACLSMMLGFKLGRAGHAVDQLDIHVTINLDVEQARIGRAEIVVVGYGPSAKLDSTLFKNIVDDAADSCPISKAMKGNIEIIVRSGLGSGTPGDNDA